MHLIRERHLVPVRHKIINQKISAKASQEIILRKQLFQMEITKSKQKYQIRELNAIKTRQVILLSAINANMDVSAMKIKRLIR